MALRPSEALSDPLSPEFPSEQCPGPIPEPIPVPIPVPTPVPHLEHEPAHAEHHPQQVHVVGGRVFQRRVGLGGRGLVPGGKRGSVRRAGTPGPPRIPPRFCRSLLSSARRPTWPPCRVSAGPPWLRRHRRLFRRRRRKEPGPPCPPRFRPRCRLRSRHGVPEAAAGPARAAPAAGAEPAVRAGSGAGRPLQRGRELLPDVRQRQDAEALEPSQRHSPAHLPGPRLRGAGRRGILRQQPDLLRRRRQSRGALGREHGAGGPQVPGTRREGKLRPVQRGSHRHRVWLHRLHGALLGLPLPPPRPHPGAGRGQGRHLQREALSPRDPDGLRGRAGPALRPPHGAALLRLHRQPHHQRVLQQGRAVRAGRQPGLHTEAAGQGHRGAAGRVHGAPQHHVQAGLRPQRAGHARGLRLRGRPRLLLGPGGGFSGAQPARGPGRGAVLGLPPQPALPAGGHPGPGDAVARGHLPARGGPRHLRGPGGSLTPDRARGNPGDTRNKPPVETLPCFIGSSNK